MPLLDKLIGRINEDREQLAYLRIEPSHVQRPAKPQVLTAGEHYIRLWLCTMFLKSETRWFKNWYPAVHSVVRLNFGNQVVEIPVIADPTRVAMQRTSQGDVIARNYLMTPTMPFNGGVLSLSAGLFALQGQNYLANFLKVLGSFASLLSISQLSSVLNVVQPLAQGIQELFTSGDAHLHLGLHDSFVGGGLEAGYVAAIRAPRQRVNASKLWVVNDELHSGESLESAEASPFTEHDYMLFRFELLDKRDDWESLTAIQEPFQDALRALQVSMSSDHAAHYMRTALLKASQSPDLTVIDRRRVVDRLIEKYEEAKNLMGFKGALGDQIPSLKQIMRAPMSMKRARGKGEPTVREIFDAVPLFTSAAMGMGDDSEYTRGDQPPGGSGGGNGSAGDGDGETAEPESAPAPSFYFELEGDDARGNQVKLGAKFDFVFNYGVPGADALTKITGGKIEELLKEEKAELGITVIPTGFILTDSKLRKVAKFSGGLIEAPVTFHLQAASEPVTDSGLFVSFDRNGAVLYEFFLPISLVASLDATLPLTYEPLDLNLDEVLAAKTREEITARLLIFADGDALNISYESPTYEPLVKKLTTLSRGSLTDLLSAAKGDLEPVPTHTVWSLLDDPLAAPQPGGNAEKAFRECLDRVASAGWSMYKKLSADKDLKEVLEDINQLPRGSRLGIRTDCAFLPWEIIYPFEFSMKFQPAVPLQPQDLWGSRLLIECLLSRGNKNYKPPIAQHRSSPSFVSLNLYRTIDKGFEGNKFLPGKSHETLKDELTALGIKSEIRAAGSEIMKVFGTGDYKATFIYLFCHGQNDKALDPTIREKLKIDENDYLGPDDMPSFVKYPCGPIVFLNSCSSGAFSPLSLSTFLSAFKEKQALGLIATSFPVPISFGSAFAQELIRRHLKERQPIGHALLDLRRELLANGNPLGFFYSLQCPMDIEPHQN